MEHWIVTFNICVFHACNLLIWQICHVRLSPGKGFSLVYYTKHPFTCKGFYFLLILMRLWASVLCCLLPFAVTKKKELLGGGQFYTSLSQSLHNKKTGQELKHDRNFEAVTEQKWWRNPVYWSDLHLSTSYLPYSILDCISRGMPLAVNWATPPYTVIKTKLPEKCLNVNLIKPFSGV